ncbi:MAG: FKBP-type peptidyl-prolyl cis-trans isomerase [Pseudomonadota bacterium]
MKIKLALAGALAAALAACGGSDTNETTEEDVAVTLEFADYAPWNPDREGVQTTDSGLQYLVVREGPEGAPTPASARDSVTVMYEGRIADSGEKFDSSYDRGSPASFPLNRVIAGWTEGLQLMSEGDEYIFFIPSELGYGQNPRPGGVIQPGDDLMFRVELQSVALAPPPREANAEAWSKFTPWNSDLEEVRKTGTGLEYVIIKSGDEAGAQPTRSDNVVVHYEGRLNENGETFDSSFAAGQPAVFPAGRLIPGFVEALSLMRPGDHWLIYIPSRIGYGEEGTPGGPIPPYADLVFELELIDIIKAG